MKLVKTNLYKLHSIKLSKLRPCALRKLDELEESISKSPKQGIGCPEQLKGYRPQVVWSRRIIGKHRLIYEIRGDLIIFLSCYGHYKDH
ncbi:MAG: type II toxin-antitoxin system YoeB family toxin [Puniceicoccales bacterium]|nr:type II toxin-antitoxin system YoeB family toxin [Puniceicoccales bacterium]